MVDSSSLDSGVVATLVARISRDLVRENPFVLRHCGFRSSENEGEGGR